MKDTATQAPADAAAVATAPRPETETTPATAGVTTQTIRCCLCGAEVPREESDNPWPLDGGDENARCCHSCDETKVLPARLRMEKPPVHAPGLVMLTAEDAKEIASWLRAHLSIAADMDDDAGLVADSLVSLATLIARLEGAPGY